MNRLTSSVCNQTQLESRVFQNWARQIKEPTNFMHRKVWEFAYIIQALHERKMLRRRKRGLGFAVGKEPLSALFAKHGCAIVATDLDFNEADHSNSNWVNTNQHAARIDDINEKGICDRDLFLKRVNFRPVDMNNIPIDLNGFDFCWSSCAFEHLGSIQQGKEFIYNMMDCLKPGGVAVHTTEFNVSSNTDTVDNHHDVLFRKCDIEDMADKLRKDGHVIELDFSLGDREADVFVDSPPFKHDPHLRFQYGEYVSTSIGLIIQKKKRKWWQF